MTVSDFEKLPEFAKLRINDSKVNPSMKDVKITLSIKDLAGNTYNAADFAAKAGKTTGFKITFNLSLPNGDKDPITRSQEYKITQTKAATSKVGVTKMNAKFTTPFNVAVNSDVLDATLSRSFDLALTNQDGDAIKHKVSLGSIYTSRGAAIRGTSDKELKDSTFKEKGEKYYEAYTVTVSNEALGKDAKGNQIKLSDLCKEYLDNDGSFTINGEIPGLGEFKYDDAKKNEIRFVREIKVGNEESNWKVEDIKDGIVVVGDKVAALYNDDNQFIENRSLAKDTAWQTNKKRTNAKGEVQYRVSTHEWVNAADVKLSQGSSTTDPETVFTDVQNLETPIVVSLAGPSSFNYYLYNSKGQMVTYRGLGGDSAWLVSKIAKDKDGNKMYRVSTDEWLMAGDGLTEVK